MERKLPSFSKGEKKLYLLCCGLLLAFVGTTSWWRWLNIDPVVNIPTPAPPNPNAWDFYVRAGGTFVSAQMNIVGLDRYYDSKAVKHPGNLQEYNLRYPFAVKNAWLKKNALSFRTMRQGFKYSCRHPVDRGSQLPAYRDDYNILNMARALHVESHGYIQREKWAEGLNSALDLVRLGCDCEQGVPFRGAWQGASIQIMGSHAAWETLPYLDARSAAAGARRLETQLARNPSYRDLMVEEKRTLQSHLLEMFHIKGWRFGEYSIIDEPNSQELSDRLQMLVRSKRDMMRNLENILDARIAHAALPYSARMTEPPPGTSIITGFTNTSDRLRFAFFRNRVDGAMLLAALALRAYRLDRGRYPAQLSELCPAYLKQVPADPFGAGEALSYRSDGNAYTLWSIGPDGVNNGGKPINNKQSFGPRITPWDRRQPQPESTGDIVAGINVPNDSFSLWSSDTK